MRALLIHNLRAGQRDRREELMLALSRLAEAGWEVEIAPADAEESGQKLREAVAAGIEAVIVAGGDGSLNVAIQILAGTETALGVLPVGTANVWAREIGLPLDIRGAAEVLVHGQTALADLGLINGRYFIAIAGVGFDAAVTRVVKPATKRRLGMLAYLVAGVAEALRLRGEEVAIFAHGRRIQRRILMVVINNTRLYGGLLTMAPDAFVDDGLLDISVFYGRGLWETARHAVKTLLGLHRSDPETELFRASRLRVESPEPLPTQLDGDYFCTTPVDIAVAPKALKVIVPPGHHPQFGFQVSGFGDQGLPKPETRNLKPETRNPKPETRNLVRRQPCAEPR